jgi:hypothetical protein
VSPVISEPQKRNLNLGGATVNAPGAESANGSKKASRWVLIGLILFMMLSVGHGVMVRESDGTPQFMSDTEIVDMRNQAMLMGGGLSGKDRFSEGVFLTVERDGKEHFSSFSPGMHHTPALPHLAHHLCQKTRRRCDQTWRFTVLPGTIMVYRNSNRRSITEVHVADKSSNYIREKQMGDYHGTGQLHVQPFRSEWQGVYGLDGVFRNITSSNTFKLSSPGVSWVSPPKGKCFVLWWGDYQRPKVCDAGPYYDVSITDISVVERSSEPEGILSCSNGHVNAPIAVTVREVINLNTQLACDHVVVPEGHQMLVEDDVARQFWVGGGSSEQIRLTDYAMGSVKRLVLVKGTRHVLPLLFNSNRRPTKELGVGSYNITREFPDLEEDTELVVPPGYTVTVTLKATRTLWTLFSKEANLQPVVMTFTQGTHKTGARPFSPIISIEVSKTGEHDLLPVLPHDAAIEAAAMRQLGIVSVDHFVASLMNRSGLVS